MKRIAVLGGTGFMGYDFVRLLLETGEAEPVVYCTSPRNLANLRRHELDIRVVAPSRLGAVSLDNDIDTLVNFAHPFTWRDSLSPEQQIRQFVAFLKRNKCKNTDLKLVHLSTLSVYEPFAPGKEFPESTRLKPPASDRYAVSKMRAEKAIRGLPDSDRWQLILRPTIVYGPYCRPWTDAPMRAFHNGDVACVDMSGRIQPIFGRDVSRLITINLQEFRPGVLNIGAFQKMNWESFFRFFQEIVGQGKLVQISSRPEPTETESVLAFYLRHLGRLKRTIVKDESFNLLAVRLAKRFPRRVVTRVRELLRSDDAAPDRLPDDTPSSHLHMEYTRRFFAEDRLVSTEALERAYPGFAFTPLQETRDILRKYYEYRYTDRLFVQS